MTRLPPWLEKMDALDRRYIYLALALAVALPFLTSFTFEAKPSQETLRFDRALDDAIASDKPIMVGMDFGPQTFAEMEPMMLAVLHKLFFFKKKVVFLTFTPESVALLTRYLADMEKRYSLIYGTDYAYLGLGLAYSTAIYAMGTSMETYFHVDSRGTPIGEIPVMKSVKRLADLSAVISIAGNSLPQYWISLGVVPHKIQLLVATTAVQATDYFPFVQTGQIKGIIAGGRAGAELETALIKQSVLSQEGNATRSLASQSMALLVIIGFILIGNLSFLFKWRPRHKGER